MDDYPVDGQVAGVYDPPPDENQAAVTAEENVTITGSLPIVDDILDWMAQEIAKADSIQNVELESEIPVEAQVLAFQQLADLLSHKRTQLKGWYEAWEKQRREPKE